MARSLGLAAYRALTRRSEPIETALLKPRPAGELVWQLSNEDVDGILDDACGVQRLPNGNTVIASYHARPGVKLFEVDRDKNVVWQYAGPHRVHHFQVLTTNGEPLPGVPLR